jgi:hypothetical protein
MTVFVGIGDSSHRECPFTKTDRGVLQSFSRQQILWGRTYDVTVTTTYYYILDCIMIL